MIRVGVVSDTHLAGPPRDLPAQMLEDFLNVECIVHAGDVVDRWVLERLGTIAPVHAVYGNCDRSDLCRRLSDRLVLDVHGCLIGVTHGHLGRGASTAQRAEAYLRDRFPLHVVVFGHSHEPLHERRGALLLFNPGSPTQPRRQRVGSYGILEIDTDGVRGRIVRLRDDRSVTR